MYQSSKAQRTAVALRKESVDRNTRSAKQSPGASVALRKESVDRNILSKSAIVDLLVALRKESVDRNSVEKRLAYCNVSRSPQGERG